MSENETYEVRCERCQTSFAAEWKQCVHCGGPLGRGRIFGALTRRREPDPVGGHMPSPFEPDEGAEEVELQSRGRNLIWVITAVIAMLMSALRACGNGG